MKMIIPAALIAAVIGAPALAGTMNQAMNHTMNHDGGRKLMTSLSGAMEVPGPGDVDGTGMFHGTINPGQTKVCYTLSVAKIATATMAHVHRGASGVAGPPVITLEAPVSGSSKACATITRALAKEIMQDPAGFYVNVHNAAYPAGAVRGQLIK